MKTKANMPKRTQHCDTENGKHCDTFNELGFIPSEKPTLMLLARYLGTCHTASGTVTRPTPFHHQDEKNKWGLSTDLSTVTK